MAVLLKYRVIREFPGGCQAKRARSFYRWSDDPRPIEVGGLYAHLGKGFPGLQRVLSVEDTSISDSNIEYGDPED